MVKHVPDEILAAGSNCLWIWNRIQLISSPQDREQCETDLRCDMFENEPYTKNSRVMVILMRELGDAGNDSK